MKLWPWIGLVMGALLGVAAAEDIRLANGQTVRGEITRVEPDGLVVSTADGVEKLSFFSLPEETQKRYGFDLKKMEQFRAEQAAQRRQQLEQQVAAVRERAERLEKMEQNQPTLEEQQRLVKIEGSAFFASAIVLQGMSKGARVHLATQTGHAATTMLNRDTRQRVNLGEGFIHGLQRAEGEVWHGKLFPAGYFFYTTPFGEERTIRAYATTAEGAAAQGADGVPIVSGGTSVPGTTGLPGLPGKLRGGTMLEKK